MLSLTSALEHQHMTHNTDICETYRSVYVVYETLFLASFVSVSVS